MRAAVLWTITDFLGLGYAFGCVTSGKAACPHCHSYTCSLRLGNGSKTCYMGHRRFLPENHPFRLDVHKFGSTELRTAPTPLSREEILKILLQFLERIHLERNQQPRDPRQGSH